MCGIIACVGRDDTLDTLLHGLTKLEYRGYDSAGVAVGGSSVGVEKCAGEIVDLRAAVADTELDGTVGIGHTRWSTHGPPTDENAHPHCDCTGRIAVVHNGIIENYQSLRDELAAAGHTFHSETDTEVVPHLIEAAMDDGADPEVAVREAVGQLSGSYALAVVVAGVDAVFGARHDSPLVLGIEGGDAGASGLFLASDVPAFREFTDTVVYLDDGEFARIAGTDGGLEWEVTDAAGTPVEKPVDTVEWDPERTGKSGYEHFMLKEIHEQPRALRECLRGRVNELAGRVEVDEIAQLAVPTIQFVAAGTSYHAALHGARLFQDRGVPAQAFVASEYATAPPPIGNALVVGVTQSGETADTLSALRQARQRGARTLAVTNVVGSTAARECDHALFIRSGPEIGVAATKTFATQLAALCLLALGTTNGADARPVLAALRDLPGDVQTILDESAAATVAEAYRDATAYFFIGRSYNYPVALEGALKMKEITYKHAEGFAAGELKHGPLALVGPETPVFAIVTGDDEVATKTVGNIKEVEARDAPVVAVTDGQTEVDRYVDHVLDVPRSHAWTGGLLANVQLQLVAYHTAALLDRSIDKPRNLAKSVTVE